MKTDTQNYNIDASGQTLGRLSTKIASILLGKNTTNSLKHNVVDCKINVSNASLIKVTGNKMKTSVHKRYSGYPSGLRLPTLSEVSAKKGYVELIRHSVEGMLPKNKLQNERMKNLIITE